MSNYSVRSKLSKNLKNLYEDLIATTRSDNKMDARKLVLANQDKFRVYLREKFWQKYGYDIVGNYGIHKNFIMGSIKSKYRHPAKDEPVDPMPLDQAFYDKALNCKKVKLCGYDYKSIPLRELQGKSIKDDINKETNVFASITSYYAGKIDGQVVIFKEVVSAPESGPILYRDGCNGTPDNPNTGAYELKMLLGRNAEHIVDLIRFDYRPNSQHSNHLCNGKLKVQPVIGSHIHCVNELFTLIFPGSLGHAESLNVEFKDESVEYNGDRVPFSNYIDAVSNALNIDRSNIYLPCESQRDEKVLINGLNIKESYANEEFVSRLQKSLDIAFKNRYNYLTFSDVVTGDYLDIEHTSQS